MSTKAHQMRMEALKVRQQSQKRKEAKRQAKIEKRRSERSCI